MKEHCPRPHYCIYRGSEGLYGDKCVPCGFYRGSHCFGPNGPLQKGDTLMGRKLAYVKWPWQGEPDAPYVRAGAAPDAEPEPTPKVALTPHEHDFANVGMHMQRWDTDQSRFAEGVYLAHDYDDDDYFAHGTVKLWKGNPPGLDTLQWAPTSFSGSPGEQTIAIKDIVSVSVVETTFDVAFVVHDPASSSKPWLRDAPYVQYHLDFAAYDDDYDDKDTNDTTLPAHERFYAALTSMMGNDDLVRSTTSAKIATGMLPEPKFLRVRTAGRPPKNGPESKYAVDPPPVRAMTRAEVLGPNPCAEVCPKYPDCTAARLVAYVLGKVDHVTSGVKSDFRYHLQTNEDWRKTRERIIKIHEAGEENAAEVLHEEYLVQHHTLAETETRPGYLPADWDGMKRRVKARQKKDKGAEEPDALAYPDSDAGEDEVDAYLEAKVRQLDAEAAAQPKLSAFGNPIPERKCLPWGVAAFFEQLLKELPYYHREEMAEIVKGETIKDFEVGEVIDGPNSYEKSLTVTLTKTPCEDSDDESEDDDADQASVPAERTTKTITLNTYKTPYDDNNAAVFLKDEHGVEHELHEAGTILCPGGEPLVRSDNAACPARCARFVIGYLVYGWAPWNGY